MYSGAQGMFGHTVIMNSRRTEVPGKNYITFDIYTRVTHSETCPINPHPIMSPPIKVTLSLAHTIKVTLSLAHSIEVTLSLAYTIKVTLSLAHTIKVTLSLAHTIKVTLSLVNQVVVTNRFYCNNVNNTIR